MDESINENMQERREEKMDGVKGKKMKISKNERKKEG